MNRTFKKALALCLAVIMVFSAAPLGGLKDLDWGITASALAESGTCGENVTYTYDSVTKELVISGEGPMTDYKEPVASPFHYGDIESVVIEDGVTTVGNSTFAYMDIINVTIPDSVTKIGEGAFACCYDLESITIPDGVTTIGENAFWNSNILSSIIVPDSVTSIGIGAFHNTAYYDNSDNWENDVLYIGKHLISAKSSLEGNYSIKEDTLTIAAAAFQYCKNLNGITIGNSIKEIPEKCFFNATSLKTVTLSEGLEKIGDYAFSDCKYLETINIPASVKFIGVEILKNTAWFNYKDKGLVTLDNWVYGYKGADENITVALNENIKGIADEAFKGNSNIIAFDVEESNPYFSSENGVLFNKEKTELIAYPCGKADLSHYTVPESVENISAGAFYNSRISSVTFGKGIKNIGADAFFRSVNNVYITDLESWCSINFANASANPLGNNLYINGVRVSDLVIPDTVTEIKPYAFYYCNSFTSVTIPDSVTTIGDSAFAYCTVLTSVTLGKNLETIGNYAFDYCKSLKDVFYPGSQEDWDKVSIGYGNDALKNADLYLMHKHEYTTTITKDATCTSDGEMLYTCVKGDTKTEIIPARGHKYGEWRVVINATCAARGQKEAKCSFCLNSKVEQIERLPHTEKTIPAVAATCTKAGNEAGIICEKCGAIVKEATVIEALGHDWVDSGNSVKPTCTTDGVDDYKCSRCNEKKSGLAPATGHKNTEIVPGTPADCTLSGVQDAIKCKDCGQWIQEPVEIPLLYHDMVLVPEKSTPATCTTPGIAYFECSRCDYCEECQTPNSHNFKLTSVTTEATCIKKGEGVYTCKDCGTTETREIDYAEHTDKNGDGKCDGCTYYILEAEKK